MNGGSSSGTPPPATKRRPKRKDGLGVDGGVQKPTTPKQQSSPYIGVTKYKRTGRYEAHVWNSQCTAPSASGKKGRQLHLGSFSDGERAAKAYDMACIHLKGYERANTNFPKERYHHEPFMVENHHLPLEEFVLRLRKWAQLNPREDDTKMPARVAHQFMPHLGHSDHAHSFGFPARYPPQFASQPMPYFENGGRQAGEEVYRSGSGSYWQSGQQGAASAQRGEDTPRGDMQLYSQLQHAKLVDQRNGGRMPQRYTSLSEAAAVGDAGSSWPPPGARRGADIDELSRAAASGHMMGQSARQQPPASTHPSTNVALSYHEQHGQQMHMQLRNEVEGRHSQVAYPAAPGWGPSHLLAATTGPVQSAGHGHSGHQMRLERARSDGAHQRPPSMTLPQVLPDVPSQLRQEVPSPGASPLLQSAGFTASLYDAQLSHDSGLLRHRSQQMHSTGSGGGSGDHLHMTSLTALTAAQHHAPMPTLQQHLGARDAAAGAGMTSAADDAADTSNEHSPTDAPSMYLSEPASAYYE